jgi:hypothetical protein
MSASGLFEDSSNFQNFLSYLQTGEFGFEQVPSHESLILIARDLI